MTTPARVPIFLRMSLAAAIFISTTSAFGADYLSGAEVRTLLNGSQVWARKQGTDKGSGSSSLAIAQSASMPVHFLFSPDGKVERTWVGVRSGNTETGRWWVNKKGKLCLKWEQRDKKQCSFLLPTPAGGYQLHGKGGKPRNLVFGKVSH